MMAHEAADLTQKIKNGELDGRLHRLYGSDKVLISRQRGRYLALAEGYKKLYGRDPAVLLSVPGRTEIGGNHTDHQRGRVLASSIDLDIVAAVSRTDSHEALIESEGRAADHVDLRLLSPLPEEEGYSAAMIRGVASWISQRGGKIGGLEAYTTSLVPVGAGLSTSAAFEVLTALMFSILYNDERLTPLQLAQAGQYAENSFFGKPSGLMDQTACAVGGIIEIDFANPDEPDIKRTAADLSNSGFVLCIVETGGSHSGLTEDYAAMPAEMKEVAAYYGCEFLREVNPERFFSEIGQLREKLSDRAVLRAVHFFEENSRVPKLADALKNEEYKEFRALLRESGLSSETCLQNSFAVSRPEEQGISLGLALSRRILGDRGACRVHGGGIAGAIQSFVPKAQFGSYQQEMERVFGKGCCHALSLRTTGAAQVL